MSDTTRSGRGGTRRRIAGQRRPSDHRTADPTREEDRTSTPPAGEPITEEKPARTTPAPAAEPEALVDTSVDTEEAVAPATPGEAVSEDQPTTAETEDVVTQSDSVVPEVEQDQASARLGKLLTVTIGVLLVLTLTAAVVLGIKAWQGQEAEQARSQATAAATKAAALVLSYDYRSLDKDFSAARATLTPQFAADFDQTTKVVAEQATKTKATVKAEVREVGVRDGDADRVTLLVFVNQTTTSTITQGKPRVDLNRARFTMVRNGDRWLVQEIVGL
jgi:Mce-associated membrane protein